MSTHYGTGQRNERRSQYHHGNIELTRCGRWVHADTARKASQYGITCRKCIRILGRGCSTSGCDRCQVSAFVSTCQAHTDGYVAVVRDALTTDERPRCRSAQEVRDLVGADMETLAQEQMRVILLNTRLAVMDVVTVYQGTVDTALVRMAELFRPAIVENAPSIILVHNHPSGDPTPSAEDRAMTEKAREAGALLQVDVLDHVVVALGGAVSLRESMPWESQR